MERRTPYWRKGPFVLLCGVLASTAVGCNLFPPPPPPPPPPEPPLTPAPGEDGPMPDISGLNLVALHTWNSPQYDGQCLKCHADVLTAGTLDPQIKTAHQVMIPALEALGYDPDVGVRNRDCRLCHATVDLVPVGPSSNIRRNSPVILCAACHGPNGTPPFYQDVRD